MSLVLAAIGGIGIGLGFGYAIAARRHAIEREKLVAESLEEGFRTFADHHTGLAYDEDATDTAWERTVERKKAEKAADDRKQQFE